jgi:Kef-type K+ transport system membrane component KefB
MPTIPLAEQAANAPAWTLAALRGADPVLGLALLTVLAVVVAEALHRATRLPRASGHLLVGALASPLALNLLARTDLDPWKPLLDLAIAVLVFELGTRIRPRWLKDNPWFALSCVAAGVLAGLAVTGTLLALGVSGLGATMVGAAAMSTSPVITMAVLHESNPRGQVTERLLMMTAVNSVLAVGAMKLWRVIASVPGQDLWATASGTLLVLAGSLLLGATVGLILELASRRVHHQGGNPSSMPVLQMALVITASLLAVQWTLSPLLALLVAGITARSRMRHGLTVEPQLGSAGAALGVVLFICLGVLLTMEGWQRVWPMALAIVVARAVGQAAAVVLLAKPSGLGGRQSAALTLALQPMSSLAVLLAADNFNWAKQLPGAGHDVLQALLIATTVLQLVGPVITTFALGRVARESHPL